MNNYNEFEKENLVVLVMDGVSHSFMCNIEKDEFDRDKVILTNIKKHGIPKMVEVKIFKSVFHTNESLSN